MTASHRTSLRQWPLWLTLACAPAQLWATTATGESPTSAVAAPAQWQAAAAAAGSLDSAAIAEWWKRFDDPVLDQLVAAALRHSPDLRTALSKIAAARATRTVERAGLFPSISAGASGSGSRTRNHDSDTSATSESYGASLDASWEIDLFGRRRLALSAADADLAQITENFHAVQVSLTADVASAYVTLRSTEVQLAAVRKSVEAQGETAQIAQWKEQAGLVSALDSQQAVSTLEQAKASIPSLEQTLTESRNQLAILCGRAPGELDALLATTDTLPRVPADLAVGIPAETLRQRPDVRAAARGVDAAVARTKAAQRDRLPTLSLSGSIGVDALKAGDIFSPQQTISRLVGSLTAPIFAAGRIKATIEVKTEAERQALIAYESTVLSALAEVENALGAVRHSSDRFDAITRAADAGREASTLAVQQYQAGEADMLTALDAQRTALSLDQQEVAAAAARLTAHIQLYKALGGGWSRAAL